MKVAKQKSVATATLAMGAVAAVGAISYLVDPPEQVAKPNPLIVQQHEVELTGGWHPESDDGAGAGYGGQNPGGGGIGQGSDGSGDGGGGPAD